MTYKHKTHIVDGEGKIVSNADIDFWVNEARLYFTFLGNSLQLRM